MTMKAKISSLLLLSGASIFATSAQEPVKPNVIVILIDDAGYADFGFMGSKDLKTPNIDKLATQGAILTDGHVAATVSGPSRACLISGRYGHRFGYECNPDNEKSGLPLSEETIGDIFQRNGYTTGAIGKWHLGSKDNQHPNQRGFDFFFGMKSGGRDYFYDTSRSDRPGRNENILRNNKQDKFDGYLTDAFTHEAIQFMQGTTSPFMLYLAYNAVHTPMQATREDLALFKGHPRQKLAAMTHALDRGVGELMTYLKESNKLENTLIFFLSDNGGATINNSSNDPLKGFKGNKFEGGHRVPFLVVWDGKIAPNTTFNGLSSSLDIYTTALDAAGISTKDAKNKLDGVSLLPYLVDGKNGDPHKILFWRKMHTKAARYNDYTIIMTQGVDTVLYDLKSDLAQFNDISSDNPKLLKKMIKSIDKWEEGCIKPLWIENGWSKTTDGIHRRLMDNSVKVAKDLRKPRK